MEKRYKLQTFSSTNSLYFNLITVLEGVYLRWHGVDPYTGDRLHESPLFMWLYEAMLKSIPQYVKFVFVFVDVLTAHVLYLVTKKYMERVYKEQKMNVNNVDDDAKTWLLEGRDFVLPPYFTAAAYLFNPLTILNCVGLATTIFCNFFLALALLAVVNGKLFKLDLKMDTFR